MKKKIDFWKSLRKEQILMLLLAGVLLVFLTMPEQTKRTGQIIKETETIPEEQPKTVLSVKEQMENQLQEILSCVAGVGKSRVMITLHSEGKRIIEKEAEREERSNESREDNRTTADYSLREGENVIYGKEDSGAENPFVSEILYPEVEGVLVIAQGAGNLRTVQEITEAVMALFSVEPHKIKVMKME